MNNDILDAALPFETKVHPFRRFKALFFDYLSIVMMMPVFLLPLFGIMWLIEAYTTYGCFMVYLAIYIAIILYKDTLNGMSMGKRKAGLQIVNIHTNKPASNFRCVLRNMTLLILPIEILISLLNPKRRLGDLIAGTKLNVHPVVPLLETKKEFRSYNKKQFLVGFILVFLAVLTLIYLMIFIFPIEKTHISR